MVQCRSMRVQERGKGVQVGGEDGEAGGQGCPMYIKSQFMHIIVGGGDFLRLSE